MKSNCEIIWVKIECHGNKPLYIASYYRPKETDRESTEELAKSISMVRDLKACHIWVLGDLNYPGFTWDDTLPSIKPDCQHQSLYEEFLDILNEFNLVQMVEKPTRLNNILDLFLTNNPTLVNKVTTLPGLSEHDAVYIDVNIRPQIDKQKPRKVHLYNKAHWDQFKSHMKDFHTNFTSNLEGKSVNQLWTDLKDAIHTGLSLYVPCKTVSGKKSLPWITQQIKRYIRKRDSLYHKHKRSGKESDRAAFLKMKHLVQRSIRKSYDSYLESLLGIDSQEHHGDPTTPESKFSTKKLFSYLKGCRQDSQGVAPLKKGGMLHTDNEVKATILNEQFQSVFTPKSPLHLSQICHQSVQNYISEGKISTTTNQYDDKFPTMPDITISTEGITKLLRNLQPDKAAGPDNIKPVLLKELHQEIAPALQVIFQLSLTSGTLPEDWTKARVTPIYKKGDKSTAANYRPISLTCIVCKLMEHIITSHLVKHLDNNNILYDLQHGFREKRSCETQLVMLIEDLASNLQAGRQTDLILLDFSKAFDKVNHEKLLHKLHQYGVRGNILNWIRGFLDGRTQTVVVDGDESTSVPVTSGVPQGSVLGPILFLAYINDLPDRVTSKVRLFADDTALYLSLNKHTQSTSLQQDLDHLQVWEREWDMEFNPSKCQVVRVSRARRPIPSVYHLHGQVLEVVDHAKYLGVDISANLKWNEHIDNICKKATRSLGFVKRNIRTHHPKVREAAYKTLVRPQLEYASSAWDPHSIDHTHKIEMIQRRAARWVLRDYSPLSSVSNMLDRLEWQTLEHRRSCARLTLFYKIVHHLVAVPLPQYLVQPVRLSRRSHPYGFRQLSTTKDYYKYSFFPLAVVQWNCLPVHVVQMTDLDSFKAAISSLHHPKP